MPDFLQGRASFSSRLNWVWRHHNNGRRPSSQSYRKHWFFFYRWSKWRLTSRTASATLLVLLQIVAVGGDGTFSLVYNAVFAKEMREDGLNPDTDLPNPMRMPVAGLPGGTGNAISKCATATYCAETYALYIVCGLTSPLPVCQVTFLAARRYAIWESVSLKFHSALQVLIGGKHERFNNIFSGCGSSSRAFMYGEQKRQSWGAGRLIYGMFKTLKENKNLEMKVDYLPLDSNNWETLSGPYLNVEMYAYAFDKGTRLTYWPGKLR